MVANRGYESLDAKSRMRLIDAAAELLGSEGHPAFSARRIADRAELKPQLVHYYFRSMEELVVAVFQRTTAEYFRLHDIALSSSQPIRAIWQLNCDLPSARLMTEFVALAKRYPLLRETMRRAGESFRQLQADAIARVYRDRQLASAPLSPIALATLLSALARSFVLEDAVGLTAGHAETEAFVAFVLEQVEPVGAPVPVTVA